MATGEIAFKATLDQSEMTASISKIQSSINKLARQVEEQGKSMQNVFDNMTGSVMNLAAQFGVGFSAVGFVKEVATVRGEFQKLESSFNTLLGSKEKADDLMRQVTRTAAITPFDLQGVAGAAKQLLAYGTEVDDVNNKIIQLGNIAAGMNLDMGYMTQLYGTTVSKDAMDTMDLKQFKAQGIAIDEAIAEVMHITRDKVKEAIGKGEVTSGIVKMAIEQMAGEGGKFNGMMENQSKTIAGQISNIEDAIASMYNEIGKSNEGIISDSLAGVSYLVENYEKVATAIGAVVAAYGMNKAALSVTSAVQTSQVKLEVETLKEAIESCKDYGDEQINTAIKKGYLTEAEAEELLQLREEIDAKQEAMANEMKSLEQEITLYDSKINSSKELVDAQKEIVDAAQAELETAKASGDAKTIETAQTRLLTEQETLNTLEKGMNAEVSQKATAQSRLSTAQKNAETLATARNTATTQAASKAQALFARGLSQLKGAFNALKAAIISNPLGALLATLTAIGYAIHQICTYETAWEKAQKAVSESLNEGAASGAAEVTVMKNLADKLEAAKDKLKSTEEAQKDAVEGSEEEKEAIENASKAQNEYNFLKDQMISKFGKYHQGLDAEIDKLTEEHRLYSVLATDIMNNYMQKAKSTATEKLVSTFTEETKSEMDELKKWFDSLQNREQDKVESDIEKSNIADKYRGFYAEISKAIMDGKIDVNRNIVSGEGLSENLLNFLNNNLDVLRYAKDNIKSNIKNALDVRKTFEESQSELDKQYDEIFKRNNIKEEDDEDEDEDKKIPVKTKNIHQLIEEIKEAEEEYEKYRKLGIEGGTYKSAEGEKAVDADYVKNLKEKVDKLKGNYKTLTNVEYDAIDSNSKAIKEALWVSEKIKDEQIKANNDYRLKLMKESIEAELLLENDSYVKQKRLRDIKNKDEIDSIKKEGEARKEELISQAKERFDAEQNLAEARAKASGDTKFKKAVFNEKQERIKAGLMPDSNGNYNSTGEYATADEETQSRIDNKKKAHNKEEEKIQKDFLKSMSLEYEVYESQKLEITKKYEKQRRQLLEMQSEASNQKDKDMYSQLIAKNDAQQAKDLFNLDFSKFQGTEYYKAAFTDLQNVGTTTLKKLLQQFEELGSKIPDTMNPSDIEAFQRAIDNVKNELIERDPFATLKNSQIEYKDAVEEYNKANAELIEIEQEKVDAEQAYNLIMNSSFATEQQRSNAQKRYTTAIERYDKAQTKVIKSENKMRKAQSDSRKAYDKITDSLSRCFGEITNLGTAIGGTAGEIIGLVGDVGNSFINISKMVKDLGQTIEGVSQATATAIRTVETASVILAIISAVIQIAQKVVAIIGNSKSAEQYEKAKKQYESYMGILDKTIEKNLELAESTSGDAAESAFEQSKRYYEKAIEYANEQVEATKKIAKQEVNAGASGTTHTYGKRVYKSINQEAWNDAADALGISADEFRIIVGGRMEGLFDLTTEQLKQLQQEAPYFLSQLGYGIGDYVEKLVEYSDKVVDIQNQQVEKVVGHSLDDLRTDFEDLLKNMDDDTSSFTSSFSEKLRDSIINSQIEEEFSNQLKDLYNLEAKYYEDGKLDPEEYKSLMAKSAELEEARKKKAQELEEQYNFSQYNADEQEATFGGYETMSEETGTELSGRFSAMYIVQSEQLALMQGISNVMQTANDSILMGCGSLDDLKALQLIANDHLSNIATATRQMLTTWSERIENIERYTRNL